MDNLFIYGAKYVYILAPLIGLYVFYKVSSSARRSMLILGVCGLPAVYLVSVVVGSFYSHPQPFFVENFVPLIPHAVDNAFPSHHTLFVAAIAAVTWFYNRKAGYLLWSLAILVGLSRVYVGLHYLSDVAASLVIACLVTYVVRTLLKKASTQFKILS